MRLVFVPTPRCFYVESLYNEPLAAPCRSSRFSLVRKPMLDISSYDLIVVPVFFLSVVVWVGGIAAGHLLAVRNALRSRRGSTSRVFRGLADPWGKRLAEMRMFTVWLISFLIPSVGFFPVYMLFRESSLAYLLVCVPAVSLLILLSFGWCTMVGFQKSIVSAESFFSLFLKPGNGHEPGRPTVVLTQRKELPKPEE